MASTFITSTEVSHYTALRCQNLLISENYEQIRSMLSRSLSLRHALLFAEPVRMASSDSVDWYTDATGAPVPLAHLPEEKQAEMKRAFSTLAADITNHSEKLINSNNPVYAIRGKFLALALHYPSEQCLYTVGDQPVLVAWGFDPVRPEEAPTELLRLGNFERSRSLPQPPPQEERVGIPPPVPRIPPPEPRISPAAQVSPAPQGSSPFPFTKSLAACLCGFLLAIVLFLSAGLLHGPHNPVYDALPIPEWWQKKFQPVASINEEEAAKTKEFAGAQEQNAALAAQLAEARKALETALAQCVSFAPFAEGDRLRIPENAQAKKDVRFLRGCWHSGKGSINSAGEAIVSTYCFDSKGKGRQTIRSEQSQRLCSGDVTGAFDESGTLIMKESPALCEADGLSYAPGIVRCVRSEADRAICHGEAPESRQHKWAAEFRNFSP